MKYKIPVIWSMAGYMTIEANSLEEAIEECYEEDLPNGKYIDDSFLVDDNGPYYKVNGDILEEVEYD